VPSSRAAFSASSTRMCALSTGTGYLRQNGNPKVFDKLHVSAGSTCAVGGCARLLLAPRRPQTVGDASASSYCASICVVLNGMLLGALSCTRSCMSVLVCLCSQV
jgi:hypothetical protein